MLKAMLTIILSMPLLYSASYENYFSSIDSQRQNPLKPITIIYPCDLFSNQNHRYTCILCKTIKDSLRSARNHVIQDHFDDNRFQIILNIPAIKITLKNKTESTCRNNLKEFLSATSETSCPLCNQSIEKTKMKRAEHIDSHSIFKKELAENRHIKNEMNIARLLN